MKKKTEYDTRIRTKQLYIIKILSGVRTFEKDMEDKTRSFKKKIMDLF